MKDMNEYKTFEELKEELGNNYDLFMYEINLCLLQKIEKTIRMLEINIEIMKQQPSNNPLEDEFVIGRYKSLLKILKGDNDE